MYCRSQLKSSIKLNYCNIREAIDNPDDRGLWCYRAGNRSWWFEAPGRKVDLMSARQILIHELIDMTVLWLYFVVWIGVFIVLKKLILREYHIEFTGLSAAIIGALILAKVVLILRNVPLGRWTTNRPAWVDVVLRPL